MTGVIENAFIARAGLRESAKPQVAQMCYRACDPAGHAMNAMRVMGGRLWRMVAACGRVGIALDPPEPHRRQNPTGARTPLIPGPRHIAGVPNHG